MYFHTSSWNCWINGRDRAVQSPFLMPRCIKSSDIRNTLETAYDRDSRLGKPVILVIDIGPERPDFRDGFARDFPGFPPYLLRDLSSARSFGRGTASLPYRADDGSLSFLTTYPYLESATTNPSITTELEHLPVAVCVHTNPSPSYFSLSPGAPQVPLIVVVSFDARVGVRLNAHLTGHPRRQRRLMDCPEWIYMDLNTALSPWHELWNPARMELARRTTELYSGLQAQDILKITRDLHSNTASVIALREDLRLHISGAERYQRVVQTKRENLTKTPPAPGNIQKQDLLLQTYQSLEERVGQTLQNMTHQQETSQVILRQFENLLSLAFNTETVSQGQMVARLNVLATVFLPISFVATLFGMTEFTIKPVWYPLGAFIGLVVAVLVVLLLGRSSVLFGLLAFTGIGPAAQKRPVPPAFKSAVQYVGEEQHQQHQHHQSARRPLASTMLSTPAGNFQVGGAPLQLPGAAVRQQQRYVPGPNSMQQPIYGGAPLPLPYPMDPETPPETPPEPMSVVPILYGGAPHEPLLGQVRNNGGRGA